jgi:hypothetical protein
VITLFISVLIGVGLLFFLYFLARSNKGGVEWNAEQLVNARQTLDMLHLGLLPRDLVDRIFAKDDLKYVIESTPPEIQRVFLKERKKIAMAWVGRIHSAFVTLMRFHRRHARSYARLSFGTEVWLALNFAALLSTCRILQVMLYLRGPYAAPGMVRAAMIVGARVCTVSEESLAFLKVQPVKQFSDSESGQAAV